MKSFKALLLLLTWSFVFPAPIYADKALVNISFRLTNIAIDQDRPSRPKRRPDIPHKEILHYYDEIDRETLLGRTLSIDWHVINYEANKSIFSKEHKAYHLFDINRSRRGLRAIYKDKNGKIKRPTHCPTGFHIKIGDKAIIKGYGDVPVRMSAYASISARIDKDDVLMDIKRKDYRIIIFKYPVVRLASLDLKDKALENKKIEILGKLTLGDSVIVTEVSPFYYPFDRYYFEITYKSYYPSDVVFDIKDIEDLELYAHRTHEFVMGKNEEKQIAFPLGRKRSDKNRVFAILIPLFGLVTLLSEKFWRRCLGYAAVISCIFVAWPDVMNVPFFNLLMILYMSFSAIVILVVETVHYRAKSKE